MADGQTDRNEIHALLEGAFYYTHLIERRQHCQGASRLTDSAQRREAVQELAGGANKRQVIWEMLKGARPANRA